MRDPLRSTACDMYVMSYRRLSLSYFFFFNDTATTEIYTLSLHDALPIYARDTFGTLLATGITFLIGLQAFINIGVVTRSEEHTSELQSLAYLVCRLLLEKKKKKYYTNYYIGNK